MPRELFVLRKMGNEHSTTKLTDCFQHFENFMWASKCCVLKLWECPFCVPQIELSLCFFFSSKMAQMENTMFIAAEFTILMC